MGVALVAAGLFASGAATVSYDVLQVSYHQACPPALSGRMNATVRWLIRGGLPVGGLLGGALGTWLGVRATLAIAGAGSWLSVLWIVYSPLRRHRDIGVDTERPGPDGSDPGHPTLLSRCSCRRTWRRSRR